ncbi:MAG: transcriptional repressor LexA [Bacteroidales bacterium]|nr:transcriptional repressor LexA [Bacteroidales bacterium]
MNGKRPRGRPRVDELTATQRGAFQAIREFFRQHGYPPTAQELADLLGISAPSAHALVGQLVRKEYLRREPLKARGLSIARELDMPPQVELVSVPIIGEVAAGIPILAQENVVGEVLVESSVVRGQQCFALRIKGKSMIDAGIDDKDLVIVRRQPIAENNDIVVALLGDEATVKRLSIKGPRIELRPENQKFKPMVVEPDDELRILGKVVAVRRGS